MGEIDRVRWGIILKTKPVQKGDEVYSNFDHEYTLTEEQVKKSGKYHQHSAMDYYGDIWYDTNMGQFYNEIMRYQNIATIIEGDTLEEVVEMAIRLFSNKKGVVLKSRAENYSMDELISMKTINSKLYFQIQDHVTNNRDHPLFLIGSRGFGKTFNVMKVIANQSYLAEESCKIYYEMNCQESVPAQEREKVRLSENRRREKRLKQSLKSPTVFIFKKNERQEIWKPIEGEYIESADLNEVFNASSIIVFDDIHYICEDVINKKLSVDILITLFKNILKTSKLKIPIIMISDEMISRYAGQMDNDEIDDLVLMFGEVSFRKMQELPKIELRDYLNKRNYLAKLELPSITYKEFDSLFKISNVDADDFVKNFLYNNSNGNPRGFARFVSVFHSQEITIDDLIRIAKKRLSNHKKYNQYLQAMEFPVIPIIINNEKVAINDDILPKAISRFKTFKKFYSFAQEKWDFKQELHEKIDLNYRKAHILFEKRNGIHQNTMSSQIIELSRMTKNPKYLQRYKKFMKIIEKEFSDIFKQIPEIPELTRWKTSYDRYINTCDSLVKLKEYLRINDVDFENFWKIIPDNYYSNGKLVKPFLLAFNKELSEGWYLDKKKFEL